MFVRVALTLFALFCFSWTFAENITAEQALQLAQTFVGGQKSGPNGRYYSPGMTPQLTQAKKVSGLYVFNIANDGGFIIVSNDDRTTPILGFGGSGHLDPDNMPSNMRAWLQGYADEIVWLQTHDVKPSRMSKAPQRLGTHSTDAIAPMVTTTWNQGWPYNNLCPNYSGSNRSATGCVATAMAQVMKYHEWPQDATTSVPGYTSRSYNLTLPTLPAVTFDWANMQNDYLGGETSVQQTAVATLMKYCGYSVQMDYGPSSGSNTNLVAEALVNYYDYNATTQFVTRGHYTYANWIDLIYYELAHKRPVVYGGMSTGGGHEFVCDGYKYENGTDFFHINWGWGGVSDNYFVLSALDPDEQGIGGSSSTDGFYYGQDAVIGIQPSTGTGTIADITPNEINLAIIDAYANPSTVLLGQSVDMVVKVTNNSQAPYDGDIMLYEETGIYEDILAKVIYMEPGETKEYVFTFTPTELGSYSFVPLRNDFYYFEVPQEHKITLEVVEEMAEIPEGLTVCDGTVTNRNIPAYIYYFDDYARSQFVIPAADLVVMEGGSIKSISFYTNSSSTFTTDSPVDVYMKEVNYTTINAFETKESATIVYQGKLRNVKLSNNSGLMTITLSTPYNYEGGNLLIGIENTADAGYKDVSFYGKNAEGASISGYDSNSLNNVTPTQQNFLPKTTFAYEASSITSKRPTNLEASEIGPRSAILSWTENSNPAATAWVVAYKAGGEENFTEVNADSNPYTLIGLTPETEYTVKVRPVADNDVIKWSNEISFTTGIAFPVPTAVTANHITATTADIAWAGNAEANSYNLRYRGAPVSGNTLTKDFEDSAMGEWTTIDADGDGYDWVLGSASGGIYLSEGGSLAGSGHNNSQDFATSGSFSNVVGALNPDNYLVSPLITLGGSISFYAWAQDADYSAEHFGVAVSTTSNTDPAAFTTIQEWTMTSAGTPASAKRRTLGSFGLFTVDLSAYAGQTGYVAIRHFNCTDQFMLNIDDIVIEEPGEDAGEWIEVNNVTSPYTITELTPETKYIVEVLAVYDEGESKWVKTSFTTLEDVLTPSALAVSNVTWGTADLNWTENGDATAWEVCLNGDEENLIAADSNPFTVEGLTPETEYTAKVRAARGDKKSKWSNEVIFTTDLRFHAPTDLVVSNVTATTAEIGWTADAAATGAVLEYANTEDVPLEFTEYKYDNGTYATSVGLGNGNSFRWGVMFPAGSYTGKTLSKVSVYDPAAMTGSVTIYNDGQTAPENPVATVPITFTGINNFIDIEINTTIDDTKNVWVIFNNESGTDYPAACSSDNFDDVNGRWVELSSSWYDLADLGVPEYCFMIRAEIGSTDFSALDWTSVADVTSPYKLTGLTPETAYTVRVKSIFEGGESKWTSTSFTTNELLELADDAADNSVIIADNEGKFLNVMLAGHTLYKDGKWNTICLPFNVTIEGSVLEGAIARELTAAEIDGNGEDKAILNLTFSETASTLVAGTPYLIRWTDGEDIENPVFEGVTIDNTDRGFVSGSGNTRVSFLGNYDAISFTDDNKDGILLLGSNNELRYAREGAGLGACRAYFKIGEDGNTARITAFSIDFGDETTGIRSIENESLTKDNDDAWYTLDGRKLEGKPVMKGVYINKGNRIMIK